MVDKNARSNEEKRPSILTARNITTYVADHRGADRHLPIFLDDFGLLYDHW